MASKKSSAWWALPTSYKDLLQEKRAKESRFGGAEAAGAGLAPYFWGQEYGNPAAQITARHFITGPGGSFARFQPTFVSIMTKGITT